MRVQFATVMMTLALAGCAAARTPPQTFGAYELLQPRLSHGPSGTTLRLGRPAHVQILQISSEGVVRLYPRSPDHEIYFEAGSHPIDLLPWEQSMAPGTCAPYESSSSAWPDERDRRPSTRDTRSSTRRGKSTLCTGSSSSARPPRVREVLLLTTERPLEPEQLEALLATPPAAGGMEALAARLGETAGTNMWAAYHTQISAR